MEKIKDYGIGPGKDDALSLVAGGIKEVKYENDENPSVTVVFAGRHRELFEEIEKLADEQIRTLEGQILFILHQVRKHGALLNEREGARQEACLTK